MKSLRNNPVLEGKVIIVAGCTGGIGSATCRLLAKHGAQLVLPHRRCDTSASAFLDEILLYSPASISLQTDLSSTDDWRKVIECSLDRYERIDAFVDCAGHLVPGSFENLTDGDIRVMVESNLTSMLYGIRQILESMRTRGKGQIVVVGSLGGIVPMPFEAVYSATKFAVRGFILALQDELKGTGIDVCLVSPGPVRTRMLNREAEDDRSTISFVNKPIEPNDVARTILGLLCVPKREVILPRKLRSVALLAGIWPGLFGALFPILNSIGRARLKEFRSHNLITLQKAIS